MEFRFNKTTAILMVISLVAGFFLNYWSTRLANDRLLASLQAQLDAIALAQNTARGGESAALSKRRSDIEAQIRILKEA